MPEIIQDLAHYRQLCPIVGRKPAQWKNVEERAAGKQDDEKNSDQKARDRIPYGDGGRGPNVEMRPILHRLADAERNRDQIGQQRQPQPKRYGNREFLLDELENGGIAKITLAELKARVIPQHQQEALVRRLI